MSGITNLDLDAQHELARILNQRGVGYGEIGGQVARFLESKGWTRPEQVMSMRTCATCFWSTNQGQGNIWCRAWLKGHTPDHRCPGWAAKGD